MPELVIPVGENIGPGYIDWEEFEYVPGFTVDDIRMRLQYAEYDGIEVDSILLQFGICYGGSVRHAMDIHNFLRGLNLPIRSHVMSVTASSGTIVALAADEVEMEHTAQWMVHRPLYSEGTYSQRSAELRADADRLDREEQNIIDLYVARTGKTPEEVTQLISVDRFMSAAEALDFGFATKVNPLAARAKAPSAAAVQARAKVVRLAVARADRQAARLRPKATPKAKAKAKPGNAALTPRPMAKTTPAAKPAAKKPAAAPTAQQKANAQIVADLAKKLGVKATIEGAADTQEVEAVVETTVLANGDGTLYTDGTLAVDSAVFNDEALTTPTADGVYGTEDGRDITIAGGVVTAIEDTADADSEEEQGEGISAVLAEIKAMRAERNADAETIKTLSAEVEKFKKVVPAAPSPKARAASGSQIDPKDKVPKPRPLSADHGTL